MKPFLAKSLLVLTTCLAHSLAYSQVPVADTSMVRLLKRHAERADYAKLGGFKANDQNVTRLRSSLTGLQGSSRFFVEYDLAKELMYAGMIEGSVSLFEELYNADFRRYFYNEKKFTQFQVDFEKHMALALLRHGEQQNCIIGHTRNSCLLPFNEKGTYKIRGNTRRAIGLLNHALSIQPGDKTCKWLLNIASMAIGQYPDSIAPEHLIPFSTFDKPYRNGSFTDIAMDLGLDESDVSGSVCLEDFDNDGDLDIFIVREGFNSQCRYYINRGDGTFEDYTHAAGLKGLTSGRTLIQADYNNDGFLDLFIVRGAWIYQEDNYPPSSLLKNNGNNTFEDVTAEAGLLGFWPAYNAAWGDYNNDGWVDIFISNETNDESYEDRCVVFEF